MDVRERLAASDPARPPSPHDARGVFQRGRRRRARRRAVAEAGTVAAVVVAAVVVWPGGGPPDGPVIDPITEAPDRTPDDEPTPPPPERDPEATPDEETIQVGEVVLTLPEDVTIERVGTGPEPCHAGTADPTLHVLEGLVPALEEDCPDQVATATSIVAAPVSTVPPAALPGHADVEDTRDVSDVALLGTTGQLEVWERPDGTVVHTYAFLDLDLYLDVRDPQLSPGIVDGLLESATRAEDVEASGVPPLDTEASREDRESPPAGASDLVISDVRVGVHDGFDRVTIEFDGEGQVGWFTELGDEATEHGSGRVIDVAGDGVLTLWPNMLAFPPDLAEGTERWDGDTVAAPAGAGVLTEVVDSGWYEGQHQLVIGLTEPVPYRLVRLEDPQRIVVDLLHPGS